MMFKVDEQAVFARDFTILPMKCKARISSLSATFIQKEQISQQQLVRIRNPRRITLIQPDFHLKSSYRNSSKEEFNLRFGFSNPGIEKIFYGCKFSWIIEWLLTTAVLLCISVAMLYTLSFAASPLKM